MSGATYLAPEDRAYGIDIVEPRPWKFDGGSRRESVIDPNWNDRVVRRVGWRTCMHCRQWFFSQDVARVRLHSDCDDPDFDLL